MPKIKSQKFCLNCKKPISRRIYCSKLCYGKIMSIKRQKVKKEEFIEFYLNTNNSLIDILQKFNITASTLYRYCKKYNLKLRGQFIDYSNKKIGKLLIKDWFKKNNHSDKHYFWNAICDCGNKCIISSARLANTKSQSCTTCRHKTKRDSHEIKKYIFNQIKRGAKVRNLEFNVTKEEIYMLFLKQKRKCALTGVDIKFSKVLSGPNKEETTASLDRIDSNKGYINGNIQWVHKTINYMKQNLNENEFITWCTLVSQYNQKLENKKWQQKRK